MCQGTQGTCYERRKTCLMKMLAPTLIRFGCALPPRLVSNEARLIGHISSWRSSLDDD